MPKFRTINGRIIEGGPWSGYNFHGGKGRPASGGSKDKKSGGAGGGSSGATEEQMVAAANEYASGDYEAINSFQRSGAGGTKEVKQTASHLSQAIDKYGGNHKAMTLYRGTDTSYLRGLSVGDDLLDPGFISASLGRSSGLGFAVSSNSPALLKIDLPKSVKAINLEALTPQAQQKLAKSSIVGEQEFLIKPGTRFKIKSISTIDNPYGAGKVRVYHVVAH